MKKEKALSVWIPLGLLVILLGAIAFMTTSCAALTPAPAEQIVSKDSFYRRDAMVEVDGVAYPGYGVLPLRDSYNFKVTTKHDMDRFLVSTCHRQIVQEKVGDSGWFSKKSTYKFTFARQGTIEKSDPCPMELVGSAESNDHTWAFFDFQSPEWKLSARIECDGWQSKMTGVSVCQSKRGFVQQISFSEPVRTSFDESCKIPIPENKKDFVFEIPRGRCAFVFCSESKECHRLTTLGYDEAFIRGTK